jgi:hypothetical protein
MFVLGTDEAGYGPNLGPLCVAASAWEVPADIAADGIYERLAEVITASPTRGDKRLAIADSKVLYKPGGGIGALERAVLGALARLKRSAKTWREIWQQIDEGALDQIDGLPWHEGFDEPLPLSARPEQLELAGAVLNGGCSACGVQLAELRAAVVFPAAFNVAVKRCDNKAEVLSLTTLRLARRVLEALPRGRAVVFCDKHGGRNFYAALLQHIFPDELVIVKHESAELSVYKVRCDQRQVEFRFQPKGERHLPTAFSSMTAKYLRELAMRPMNAFFQRHIANLKPTCGYYNDAHRFMGEIRAVKEKLGISDHVLWRER